MAQKSKSRTYEENFSVLEQITESLNKDEIGIDDLVKKTREALDAARTCMEILNKQKGEFKKLESEFSQLLDSSTQQNTTSSSVPPQSAPSQPGPLPEADTDDQLPYGDDDPF